MITIFHKIHIQEIKKRGKCLYYESEYNIIETVISKRLNFDLEYLLALHSLLIFN